MAFLVAVTDRVLQLATCQRYQVLGPVIAVCAARGHAFLTVCKLLIVPPAALLVSRIMALEDVNMHAPQHGNQRSLEEYLQGLEARIDALESQNKELRSENSSLLVATLDAKSRLDVLSKSGKNEAKIADPDPFTGNRTHIMDFLSKCRLKFAGQPSKFPTERSKIFYAGSYLKDQAYSWFQPLLAAVQDPEEPDPLEFASFDSFAKALTTIYGDPDLMATAERQISSLKQAESVAKYHAEFTRLRQHIKWNEDALKNAFYGGLKDHIKDWLSTQDRPTSLKDLIDKTLRYDARKYERFQEKKFSVQPASTTNTAFRSSQPTIYNTPTPSSSNSRPAPTVPRQEPPPSGIRGIPAQTSDGTVPMELGVKHLSAAERERRRINHLCYYCGESNHNAVNCPAKPKRIPFFQFSLEDPHATSISSNDITQE